MEEKYMRRAIELAKMGLGFTNPNPMVGAVIVKDGRIIGEGYHQRCGQLHAERNAFASLKESAEGATIYVTLEPCCHYGKTPPCTEAIIENKIAKVVIGSRDPNPLVSGKGAEILRAEGIEVVEDFLRDECDKLNEVFFHYITSRRPYVVMKYAMTADGKIATKTGASKWITGEKARNEVQHMRHKYMGIMVGIGTVLADDPMLNVRVEGLKSPVRIICDSNLSIPMDCQLVRTAKDYRTIIACVSPDKDKKEALEKCGVEILLTRADTSNEKNAKQVDMNDLMEKLGELGIDSVFVEGGGTVNDSLLRAGLVNRVEAFVAPKLFGGAMAKSPVAGIGIEAVEEASVFKLAEIKQIDDDVLISYIR